LHIGSGCIGPSIRPSKPSGPCHARSADARRIWRRSRRRRAVQQDATHDATQQGARCCNTIQHDATQQGARCCNTVQHDATCSTVQRHQHTLPCRSDTAKSGGPADSRQRLQMLLLAQPGMQAREAVPVRHSVSARFVPARRFIRYDTAISPAMHSTALSLQGPVRW
jgi:hypothetical protein